MQFGQFPTSSAHNLPFLLYAVTHDILGMSEQALGWLPLGLGLVMEDEPSELSCSMYNVMPIICHM